MQITPHANHSFGMSMGLLNDHHQLSNLVETHGLDTHITHTGHL